MIFVVLPAFNEEDGLAPLLSDISRTAGDILPGLDFCIVVVNDGSSDSTEAAAKETFEQLSQESDRVQFVLLNHEVNKGLAEALKTGLLYSIDKADETDIVLTMDSDNSHTPGLIPRMVRQIYEGHDVVIASRFLPGARILGLSLYRKSLSAVASVVFRVLFPIEGVRDYTCGYRAYKAQLLKRAMSENERFISESGFSAMVDILLKLRKLDSNLLMKEVPLLLRYDKKLSRSKMDVSKTIRQTLNLIWRRLTNQE